MPLLDTGIRHAHRIKGHLATQFYSWQDVDGYRVPLAAPGSSQLCVKVTSWDLISYDRFAGHAKFVVFSHFGCPLGLTVEIGPTDGFSTFARLKVQCQVPGYSMDLPSGATADPPHGWSLDTTTDDFTIELSFTSYTYYNDVTHGFSERIEESPTLTLGSLVVTFTRTAAPLASPDIQDTYSCGREAGVLGASDGGVLQTPLTSQPQIFEHVADDFHGHYNPVWALDIEPLSNDRALVLLDGLAWEIDETGWPDTPPVLTGVTWSFGAGTITPQTVSGITATCHWFGGDAIPCLISEDTGALRDSVSATVTSTSLRVDRATDLDHKHRAGGSDFDQAIGCMTECAGSPTGLYHFFCTLLSDATYGNAAGPTNDGGGFSADGGQYASSTLTQTSTNTLVIGSPPHLPGTQARWPANCFDRKTGAYFKVETPDGNLWAYRALGAVRPIEASVQVTSGGSDSRPSIDRGNYQGQGERLVVLFTRGSDIYRTWSDSDIDFWETPTLAFSGGGAAHVRFNPHGTGMIEMARVGDGLEAIWTSPGGDVESFVPTWLDGSVIVLDTSDGFGLSYAPEGEERLIAELHLDGEMVIRRVVSADDGHTFEIVT